MVTPPPHRHIGIPAGPAPPDLFFGVALEILMGRLPNPLFFGVAVEILRGLSSPRDGRSVVTASNACAFRQYRIHFPGGRYRSQVTSETATWSGLPPSLFRHSCPSEGNLQTLTKPASRRSCSSDGRRDSHGCRSKHPASPWALC